MDIKEIKEEIKWMETCEDKTIAMSTDRYKNLKEQLNKLENGGK